jgi:hypothetical protein
MDPYGGAGGTGGLGLAAVMIPLSAAAFVGLRHDEIPHAGIITRVAQQVGGSFGVATLAVILDAAFRNLGTHLRFDRPRPVPHSTKHSRGRSALPELPSC